MLIKKLSSLFWRHKIIAIFTIILLAWPLNMLLGQSTPTLETHTVKRADLTESIITSGKIESDSQIKLGFLTAGKLVFIGAKKGEFVKKRQTLAGLDTRTVQKNIQDELTDYLKQRNSFDDTIENNLNRTPAQALNEDMKRILQNNQYDLEKAVISVELQSLVKEQAYLVSPIDGIITQSDFIVPGVNVTASNILTVADPDNILFRIEIDEVDIGKVTAGTPVKLLLESYPDENISLPISSIEFASHTSANGGNVFYADIYIPDNPGYKYKIGMTGDAEIILAQKSGVLTVPLGSIFDNNYVYVKRKENFEKRRVELGTQSDINREVISGLKEGDEIAVIPDDVDKMYANKKRFIIF